MNAESTFTSNTERLNVARIFSGTSLAGLSISLFMVLAARPAIADETVICNETGGDIELNFIFKRSVFFFSSEWEGSGPWSLASRTCDTFFSENQYYEVMLNVQESGFFGGKSDVDVPKRGPSVRTIGGRVEALENLYCLDKVQNTTNYNEPIEFYFECEEEALALFSVYMVRFVGDSIELTLR